MKKIRFLISVILLLTLTACESLINSLSFFPDTDYIVSSEKLPVYIKPLMLDTKDGIKLEALYLHHEKGNRKIVIYFHGNACNLYHRIDEASVIYNMGHNVIISGYRGYGRSTGEPTENGIYIDGKTVLEYVSGTLHYKPENIYILGRSIGTAVAVDISQNIPLGGVILITPLSSAADFIREKYTGILTGAGGSHYNSIVKIRSLKSPVLVIHGTEDKVIPFNNGVKLYEAYQGKKLFVAIPGGGHNNLEFINTELYWNSVKNFIERN